MHVMIEQIDACNAIMIFWVHGLVIQVVLLDQIMGAKLGVYTIKQTTQPKIQKHLSTRKIAKHS